MSFISKDDVRYVARLAELEFDDAETNKITAELDRIIEHVAAISKADTSGIEPTSHTLKISNVFRQDVRKKSLSVQEALANAPKQQDGGFLVPKID